MQQVYSLDDIKHILHSFDNTLKNEYKASKFYIFGSYARGEQTVDSDIDLLVEFDAGASLLTLVSLKRFLKSIFKKEIDLGTPTGLKPLIKDQILSEAIVL